MIKRLVILILALSFIINFTYALDCQYTQTEDYQVEGNRFYLANKPLDSSPTFEYRNTGETTAKFKVYNPFSFDIDIKISYKTKSNWYGNGNGVVVGTVPAMQYVEFDSKHNTAGPVSEPKLEITNLPITQKLELVTKQKTVCKQCLGKDCLDDGASCSSPKQCGGGNCVRGLCSSTKTCFNNNCKCASDEMQCGDNMRCVGKKVTPIDVEPECGSSKECVTEYIDPESKLCSKSPSQIDEENAIKLKEKEEEKAKEVFQNRLTRILILVIILIGIFLFLYFRHKNKRDEERAVQTIVQLETEKEKEKRKKYERELELIKERQKEIARKESELRRLEELEKLHENKKEEIENHTEEIRQARDKLNEEVEKKFKDYMKPYPSKVARGQLVYRNPYLSGYECFYNDGEDPQKCHAKSRVHIWNWTKHNRKRIKSGYHIHHIDGDKYNNEIWNLIELSKEQHKKIKHYIIGWGDWNAGIRELERIGIPRKSLPKKR